MTIDTKDILNSILNSISRIDYIKTEEIPNIDLYMDQVDKILTKTMINNYAKNRLLPPPTKKKYSKEHLLILTFIYYFKNILSINDIQVLLTPLTEKYFSQENNVKLTDIYEEIMNLELSQIEPLAKDVTRKFKKSQESFSDINREESEFLQKFAFICMLSFDVYVKKQVIEQLIDHMSDPTN